MQNEHEMLINEFFSNFVKEPVSTGYKYTTEATNCILYLENFFMNPKTKEIIKKLREKTLNRPTGNSGSTDHC